MEGVIRKMAVVPSGKVTKEGKTIWKAAPTQTDVQKEVSEKRVQTFSSGGEKLSDTQRVAISSGGETKWVTPEKAMRIEPIGTLKYQEAEME